MPVKCKERGRARAFQRGQNEQTPAGDWGVASPHPGQKSAKPGLSGKAAAQGPMGGGQGPERMKARGVILTHELSDHSSTCWGPASGFAPAPVPS